MAATEARRCSEFSVERCVGHANGVVAPPGGELPELWRYWQRAVAFAGDDLALQIAADLPIGVFGMAS